MGTEGRRRADNANRCRFRVKEKLRKGEFDSGQKETRPTKGPGE